MVRVKIICKDGAEQTQLNNPDDQEESKNQVPRLHQKQSSIVGEG